MPRPAEKSGTGQATHLCAMQSRVLKQIHGAATAFPVHRQLSTAATLQFPCLSPWNKMSFFRKNERGMSQKAEVTVPSVTIFPFMAGSLSLFLAALSFPCPR